MTFGDLLTTIGDLLMTFGDLVMTFGDRLMTSGDLFETSDDLMLTPDNLWTASDAPLGERSCKSAASLKADAPLTVRRGLHTRERCIAVVKACVTGSSRDSRPLTPSDCGLTAYSSLFTADDCERLLALDLGLF